MVCPKCKNYAVKDLGRLQKNFWDWICNAASEREQHTYQCKKCGHVWVE